MNFNGLKIGTIFSRETSPDSTCKLNEKFVKSMSIFEFRKLNKIARFEIKIQEFAWRYEI
jgi:hypothetical protein